ncbi:Mitotic checkpoint serine/threonine-protein kinase [Dirofilaria immitis]
MVVGFFESLPSFVKTLPETKQLDYVLNQLKWMEQNFEDEENCHRLRKAAMETVLRYSVESNPFYNDERLLYVFCIVGKLSRTMGMKSVMEELHNRKQFYELAEFYVKWGEIFAEEKNRERFNEIWNEAVKADAKPTSRIDEAFRAMLYQYFEMDDEMTVNLFKKPESSKESQMVFRDVKARFQEQKSLENDNCSTKPTHSSIIKSQMKIADEQQSIEEIFAEAKNYIIHSDIPQSRMSISKLSAISEERSGCASGSLMNPSHNIELVKSMQPSAGDMIDDPFLLTDTAAAAENDILGETDILANKPSECPQSSHLTLHGTSFTEKFLSKAMRDFSSTVPVPPPRSVHHETNETTVLQETALNESDQTHLPPVSKKTKFEVYVEYTDPVKQTAPFNVYNDENTLPSSTNTQHEKRIETEQDLDYQKNVHDADFCKSQPVFRKPTINSHRRSSVLEKTETVSFQHENETPAEIEKGKYEEMKPPLPDRTDEETLAGLNKMAKTGAVTSTPASTFAPPIEDPIEESFRPLPASAVDLFFQKPIFDEALIANTAFGKRMSMCEQRRDTLTRLSQKFGVENIVGSKKLGANNNISEELRRLSIAPNDEDSNEIINEELRSRVESEINPWDEKLRDKIMTTQYFCPANVHDFPERCNRLSPGTAVVLGGERFDIECLIAEGGFAKVYKGKSEDGNFYAVKFQMPPCRWEVYACEALRIRMPKIMLNGIMNIRDAYLFPNASAIVYEYHKYGNLLDMINKLQTKNMSCSGLLTVYLAWEIGRILEAVHNVQIIHGDIKPDNFMILHRLNEDATLEQILDKKSFTLKLIDWGRAIDMSFLKGYTFRGKAGTVAFDCSEMQDGRPWTYQTDFYGFVSTLHVIIYGKYMKLFRNAVGRYCTTSVMKRRWHQRNLLEDIFDMCLNILDCESFPKWSTIIDGLENNIRYWVREDRQVWKQAARELNSGITP